MTLIKFATETAKLMSRMEGFTPGSRAWRNNNPGNLDAGARASGKDADGYAVYTKVSDGWADAEDLVMKILTGHPALTLRTFIGGERDAAGKVVANGYPGYAPSADPRGSNDVVSYAQFLAKGLQVASIDAPLAPYYNSVT